jgi:N6-L-threonylcarbamoyladenine synthase
MYVLGIETSCDETSAAVVESGRRIVSCQISSSLEFHKRYGGIIPEIASRKHLETIVYVVESALSNSGVKPKQIKGISVTSGPGLVGSLLVGVCFAKALSLSWGVPLLGVNHLYSHIYSVFLAGKKVSFPFVALIVSGGHTSLFYVKDFDRIEPIGATADDACGEAFDKVAKILGLGYPGGPYIEKAACGGNPQEVKFSCGNTKNPLDFSFSGIKTAVLYRCRAMKSRSRKEIADIAASFQETVIESLVDKALLACRKKRVKHLVLGGGVVANGRLREKFNSSALQAGVKVYFPDKKLCMDNAAMVAGMGYQLFKKGYRAGLDLNAGLN